MLCVVCLGMYVSSFSACLPESGSGHGLYCIQTSYHSLVSPTILVLSLIQIAPPPMYVLYKVLATAMAINIAVCEHI